MKIRTYQSTDEAAVIALWHEAGLVRPWNDPRADIARKLTGQPELFLVGEIEGTLVATAMVGFDGHRGWVYYLAVAEAYRNQSIGRALMTEAEHLLAERGCPKLNLLVRSSSVDVIAFYQKLGYDRDEVVSMGKRLIHDTTPNPSIEPPPAGGLRPPPEIAQIPRRQSKKYRGHQIARIPTQEANLLFQSIFTVELFAELSKERQLLDSALYKTLELSPEVRQGIDQVGFDNQATALMCLYSMLVIPRELLQSRYKSEFEAINDWLSKVLHDISSTYPTSNHIQHLRNAVAHARVFFEPSVSMTFRDEDPFKGYCFEAKLPLTQLRNLILILSRIHLRYLRDWHTAAIDPAR